MQKTSSRLVFGLAVSVFFIGMTLAGTSFAHEDGDHPHMSPAQHKAMKAAMQSCVTAANAPALPALPTPPAEGDEGKHKAHWEAMKTYEKGLNEAQLAEFKTCRQQAMAAAKATPAGN